jgi:hypothetical protein
MRPAIKEDGFKYYKYVLCHVDDALVVSQHPQRIMEVLGAKYVLKAGSVGEPKTYLGAKVSKYRLEHSDDPGKVRWSLLVEDYINRAVKDVETELEKVGKALPTKVTTPMTADYRPELDRSRELGPEQATYFAGLIGVLCWCIELGRTDIIVGGSVSSVSLSCESPRGTSAASTACLRLSEETCAITDGVRRDSARDRSIAFSGCRLVRVLSGGRGSHSSGHAGTEGTLGGYLLLC